MNHFKKLIALYTESFSGLSKEIWLLSFVMLINRAGAMVMPFMSLYLTSSLGFSLTDTGYILACYGTGSVLGAFAGGNLTDKYGFYHVQLYSLLVSAIALFVLIFLKTFISIAICVFLFSLISDMLRPANSVAIAAYSLPENRTRSFSLMRLAINLGFSLGPALGGLIAGYIGFKWIFLVDGVTCLWAAWLLVRYLPFKSQIKKAEPDKTIAVVKGLSAYNDPKYIGFIILVSLFAMVFFQLFTSIPVFLESKWGMTEIQIGMLMALNGLLIVVLEMPIVRYLENYKRIMILISLGCVLMAVSYIFLQTSFQGALLAILFVVFITFAEIMTMPFMINYAVSRPTPDRQGQYMALYSIAYGLAHIIAPLGGMYIADELGFSFLYTVMIGLSLLIAYGFYLMRKRQIQIA
ncbi:MAG: MFS transporter [Saprospiraceae bacterium]|nr:MFS transporter [Saprospiraceae bacterium]